MWPSATFPSGCDRFQFTVTLHLRNGHKAVGSASGSLCGEEGKMVLGGAQCLPEWRFKTDFTLFSEEKVAEYRAVPYHF